MLQAIHEQGNVIFNKLLPGIMKRIESRNGRLIKSGIINAEQIQDDGLPPPTIHNRNDAMKYYCQYCWQRYVKKHKHTVDICVRSQALRNFMINIFHQHQ